MVPFSSTWGWLAGYRRRRGGPLTWRGASRGAAGGNEPPASSTDSLPAGIDLILRSARSEAQCQGMGEHAERLVVAALVEQGLAAVLPGEVPHRHGHSIVPGARRCAARRGICALP